MIVAAVLAAGGSRRLGRPKQLVAYGGRPLVVHAVAAASLVRAAIVLGAHEEAVAAVLETDSELTYLRNLDWQSGMASSVQVATRWAESLDAEALILHLVDQPLIDRAHLARLIEVYQAGAPLAGSSYAGVVGAPAIFARSLFPDLLALSGDRGAASLLRSHPAARSIPGPEAAIDVDTPEDVQRLEAALSRP